MATYSVVTAKTAALVAATVDTVTLTGAVGRFVRVINQTGSAAINVTFAIGATPAVPTSGGDNTDEVPAAVGAFVDLDLGVKPNGSTVQISLISTGTPTYTVESIDRV